MVIIDFSQLCLANIHVMLKDLKDEDGNFSVPHFRAMIMASLRKNLVKFRKDYGPDIILAIDSGSSWRRDYFKYYKANRKKEREESGINWTPIFEAIRQVKDEIRDNFPYRVIEVPNCEADDVISTLAHKFGTIMANETNKILIISGDKDYGQLQKFGNVFQYDPKSQKTINVSDPELFLIEHIIKGDKTDGIPNMLSSDDTYVTGSRSTTISAKRLAHYTDLIAEDLCEEIGYHRNRLLIDLAKVPENLKINIIDVYEEQAGKPRNKIMTYFVKNRLTRHLENLGDF